MHYPFRFLSRPALLAVAVALPQALGSAEPARAQAVTDYRLPAGQQPRAPGPVDPENPAAPTTERPRTPPPGPSPTAEAAPVTSPSPPLIIPPSPGVTARAGARTRATDRARPAPEPAATPAAAATAITADTPPPAAATVPAPGLESAPVPQVAPAPEATTAPAGTIPWWWLLPAALLGGAAVAAFLLRRRSAEAAPAEFIRPEPAAPSGFPREPDPAPPVATPARQPAPRPAPAPASPDLLDLTLEPLRFSVTLVNAALQYRLTIANRSDRPLGPLHIAADMIAAHASLPEAAQLGQDGSGLELRHELPELAPGTTAEFRGDLRLPLASVTPIRAGGATLIVPLVRLRVEGAGLSRTTALVVGEPPAAPGGPLRPFRLDQGPRIFGAVSQRALATAA